MTSFFRSIPWIDLDPFLVALHMYHLSSWVAVHALQMPKQNSQIKLKKNRNKNLRINSATNNTFYQILISSFGNLHGSEAKFIWKKHIMPMWQLCATITSWVGWWVELEDELSWLFTTRWMKIKRMGTKKNFEKHLAIFCQ